MIMLRYMYKIKSVVAFLLCFVMMVGLFPIPEGVHGAADLQVEWSLTQDSRIALRWEPVDGAVRYSIMFREDDHLLVPTENNWTGTTYVLGTYVAPEGGTRYCQVTVIAYGSNGASIDSHVIRFNINESFYNVNPLEIPEGVGASIDSATAVRVSWEPVFRATGYDVLFNGTVYSVSGGSTQSRVFTGLSPSTTYSYAVRAKNTQLTGAYSSTGRITTPAAPLPMPVGVTATATKDSATVSWSAVSGATGYKVLWNGTTYSVSGTSRTFTGLMAGTAYTYAVQAVGADTGSVYSAQKTITTLPNPPSTPTGVTAAAAIGSVTVSWKQTAGAAFYDVRVNGTEYRVTGNTTVSKTVTGLASGTAYTYAVRAGNEGGTSAYSAAQTITTLPPDKLAVPEGVTATPTAGTVTVRWNAVNGATGYDVAFNGVMYSVTGTSREFTGLSPGTSYKYYLRAKNASAVSDYCTSRTVMTNPAVPFVTATATTSSVTLSWSAIKGATVYYVRWNGTVYSVTGTSKTFSGLPSGVAYTYEVQAVSGTQVSGFSTARTISTKEVRPGVPILSSASATPVSVTIRWFAREGAAGYDVSWNGSAIRVTGTTYTVRGLKPGTNYSYALRSYNSAGNSAYSATQTIKTPLTPGVPTGVTADITDEGVRVSWQPVEGATGYEVRFDGKVYSAPLGEEPFLEIEGLTPNTGHTFTVQAKNQNGLGTASPARNLTTAPKAPSAVREQTTEDSIRLSWDAVEGAKGYEVKFDGDLYPVTDPYIEWTGLSPGSGHTYAVRSNNDDGASSFGSEKAVNTPTRLKAPENVKVSVTEDGIFLSWDPVYGALGYEVILDGTVYDVDSYDPEHPDYVWTGLTAGSSHTVSVRAKSGKGPGDAAADKKAATAPKAPADVKVETTRDSVRLSWNPVAGANGYDVAFDGAVSHVTDPAKEYTGLTPDSTHTYAVRSANENGSGSFGSERTVRAAERLKEPSNVSVSATEDGIRLRWDPMEGAVFYEILFDGVMYEVNASDPEGPSLELEGLSPNTGHTFTIRANNENGYGVSTPERTTRTTPRAPETVREEITGDGVRLSWDPVEGATGYDVAFDGEQHHVTEPEREFPDLPEDSEHTYAVRSNNRDGASSFGETKTVTTPSEYPAYFPVRGSADFDSVKITWPKVEGATGYQVRFDDKLYDVGGNNIRFLNLQPNTMHTFSVRPKAGEWDFSSKQTIYTKTDRQSGLSGDGPGQNYPDGRTAHLGLDPVNALTGAFVWSYTALEGYGKDPIPFTLLYDSKRDGLYQSMGGKWTYSLNYRLTMDEAYAYFGTPYGDVVSFRREADGSFPLAGTVLSGYRMEPEGGGGSVGAAGYIIRDAAGMAYQFNTSLALMKITENGRTLYSFRSDAQGRTIAITGPYGGALSLQYTGSRLSGVTDGLNRTVILTYTGDALTGLSAPKGMEPDGDTEQDEAQTSALSMASDQPQNTGGEETGDEDDAQEHPADKSMGFAYDEAGNLTVIRGFSGQVYLTNHYDEEGRVVRQEIAGRGTSTASYDTAARITTFTDEAGEVTRYYYDARMQVTDVKVGGASLENTYTPLGQIETRTDPLGRTTGYSYDEAGRLGRIRYPDGTEERVTYQADNLPVEITNRDGTKVTYTYDARGNLTRRTDERGNQESFTYDAYDNLLTYTDRTGSVSAYTYDENHHLKTYTDPEGNRYQYTFDAIGRLRSFTLPNGRTSVCTWTAAGDPIHLTDPDGTVWFAYDANGSLTGITDKKGNGSYAVYNAMGQPTQVIDFLGGTYGFTYDETGDLTGETDPLGNRTGYMYDDLGNLTELTDPLGNTYRQRFDGAGQLTEVSDPEGGTFSYTYDRMGRVETVTDPLGHQSHYTYDSMDRVTGVTDPLGNTQRFTYDQAGNLLTLTDENGSITAYTYDAENRVKTITTEAGTADGTAGRDTTEAGTADGTAGRDTTEADTTETDTTETGTAGTGTTDGTAGTDTTGTSTTTFTYDRAGRLTAVTDAAGHTETAGYDSTGNPVRATDPEERATTYTYDSAGRLTGETDPVGSKTTYGYDRNGNCVTIVDGEGHATTFTYDLNGRLTESTDPLGSITAYTYDRAGNLTVLTDPMGGRTLFTYDGNGNLLTETNPLGGKKQYTYDRAGRLTGIRDENGSEQTVTYDAAGNVTAHTDGNGFTRQYTYDALNRLTAVTGPDGGEMTYTYGKTGELLTVTDPEGAVTTYTYDPLGRLTGLTDGAGHSLNRTYDRLDRLVSEADGNGNRTLYTYSPAGDLLTVTDPEGGVTTYTYDEAGRMLTTTDPTGGVTGYAYDRLGQVTALTDPLGAKTTFTYDAAGAITTITDGAGSVTAYEYDRNGNLTGATDALGHTVTYEYDAMNHQIKASVPYSEDGQTHATLYYYDQKGQMIREINAEEEERSYRYDGNGNLSRVVQADGDTTDIRYDLNNRPVTLQYGDGQEVLFRYNKRGELVEMRDRTGTTTLSYDPAGTLTAVTDPAGRTTGYQTDPAGNITAIDYPDGSAVAYAYDQNNRLTTVTDGEGQETGYRYDAAGRLLNISQPTGRTEYVYNAAGFPTQVEYALTDGTTRQDTLTYDALGRATRAVRSGSTEELTDTLTYTYDAMGQLSSYSDGSITETYDYDPRGNLTERTQNGETTASYRYGSLNQLLVRAEDGGVFTYQYDRRGNQTEERRNDVAIRRYEYDSANLLTAGYDLVTGEKSEYLYNGLHMRVQNIRTLLRPDDGYRSYETSEAGGNGVEGLAEAAALAEAVETAALVEAVETAALAEAGIGIGAGVAGIEEAVERAAFGEAAGGIETIAEVEAAEGIKPAESELTDPLLYMTYKTDYVIDYLSGINHELMAIESGFGTSRITYGAGGRRLSQQFTPASEVFHQPRTEIAAEQIGTSYFQSDILGSVIFASNENGEILRYTDRDPWGTMEIPVQEDMNSAGVGYSLQFTNYSYDEVLDKYFAQARVYDAGTGRMLSRDPLEAELNPYLYSRNDPVNYVDPTGEISIQAVGGLAGFVAGAWHGVSSSINDQRHSGRKVSVWEAVKSGFSGGLTGAAKGVMYTSNPAAAVAGAVELFSRFAAGAKDHETGPGTFYIDRALKDTFDGFFGIEKPSYPARPNPAAGDVRNGGNERRGSSTGPFLEDIRSRDPRLGSKPTGIGSEAGYLNSSSALRVPNPMWGSRNQPLTWSKAIDTVWDTIDMAMLVGGIAKGLFNLGKKLMPAGRGLFGSIRTRIFGVPTSGASTGGIAMDLQFFGADDVGRYADDLAEAGVRNGSQVGETYYRTMSQSDYDYLRMTGEIPATRETFISPTQSFSNNYSGVTIQLNMRRGTTNSLLEIGVGNNTSQSVRDYGRLQQVSSGWNVNNAFFKGEGIQTNIGLGQGRGLEIFNRNLIDYLEVGGKR